MSETPFLDFVKDMGIEIDESEWEEPPRKPYICPPSPLGRIEPEYLPPRNWVPPKRRPVHHYCRIARFTFTLGQLLGFAGKVPDMPFFICRMAFDNNQEIPLKKIWNVVRTRLKLYNFRLYYNRIPTIIRRLNLPHVQIRRTPMDIQPLLLDFIKLHETWNKHKSKFGRSYFPNLRYIALRLMEKYNLMPPYTIPFARTFRKKKSLDLLFDELTKQANNQ